MVRLSTCIDNHFVFNAPAATAIYTLSLHDALPILESLRSYEVEGAVSLCYPASRFAPGDRVRLCDGPFEGLIATVLAVEEHARLQILMHLLNRGVRVRVPTNSVAPANASVAWFY